MSDSSVFFSRTFWLQCWVAVSIALTYFFLAPNYDWDRQDLATAYGADFLQEWVGARMVLTGHAVELYDVDVFRSWQYDSKLLGFEWKTDQYFPPVYPPSHYVLFTPFAFLPYRWAVIAWLLILIVSAFASAKLIADAVMLSVSRAQPNVPEESKSNTKYIWIGLILFPSTLFSVSLGQKSACWLLLICATWRLLQCHRDYAAGLVFGILSIKPTLFFLVPLVMLRNGNWRFFIGASVSVVAIWGGTACVVPVETWVAFFKVVRTAGSYAEISGYHLDWSCNLMAMAYSVPTELTTWCKFGICVPLAVYLLYCVFEDRHYSADSPEKALMLLGSTLLLSPHTYHYDLCVLMLPILWLATTEFQRGLVYYGILAIGVTIAGEVQELFRVPVVPVLLFGMVCELKLRNSVHIRPDQLLDSLPAAA